MKKALFSAVILFLSVVLVGCAGLGNIQQRSSYYNREVVKVCDDSGCRNQLVEVQKDVVTDEPAYQNGPSYMNVGIQFGRRGYIQMGNYNGGYYGYPVYNAYRMPVMYPGRPMPGCIGAICW